MTIPADIREKAERVTFAAINGDSVPYEDMGGWRNSDFMIVWDEASEVIARAILEERERCAQIAESNANKRGWNYHLPSVGREIASAIRKGQDE